MGLTFSRPGVGAARMMLTLILVGVSATMLFVPVVEGASDIRAMFLLLTGVAVRDFFSAVANENASEAEIRKVEGPPLPPPVSH